MERKLSAWDLIDEILTEMSDQNFKFWASDRVDFRDILIDEIKDYIVREDITITNHQPEREEESGEWA